jgi:dTDP-4-amino-4,6-dideoxygalactose transaminase
VTDIAPTRITFNRPGLGGKEFDYIREAVEGGHTSMSGPFTGRVVELLTSWQGSEDVLLTTSCTDALEMSALLLDIEPGDTVIVPSFTFVSSALAFVRAGARLIFADIEPVTLGVDPDHVGQLMNDSVRAVVAVHYAGIGCDIDGLRSVLEAWPRAELIEDNAQGLFGTYRDEPLGSFGRFSAISFHETKNFICGEGGALVVNRPDDVDRAHVLLNKGTDRRAFMLGQVDKYSWRDIGSSFGLSDMLAAYLLAQLEERDRILVQRRGVFERYRELLTPSAERGDLTMPVVPDDRVPAYHMFYVLLPDRVVRNKALAALAQQGIQATFHYVPLHSSDGGIRFSAYRTECPVTDDISSRLLRLPFYNDLSDGDTQRIAELLVSVIR